MLLLAWGIFVNSKYLAKCFFQRSNKLNMFINTCLFSSSRISNLSRQNVILTHPTDSVRPVSVRSASTRVRTWYQVHAHYHVYKRSEKSDPLLQTEAPISRTRNGAALEKTSIKGPFQPKFVASTELANRDGFRTEHWLCARCVWYWKMFFFFLDGGGDVKKKKKQCDDCSDCHTHTFISGQELWSWTCGPLR